MGDSAVPVRVGRETPPSRARGIPTAMIGRMHASGYPELSYESDDHVGAITIHGRTPATR